MIKGSIQQEDVTFVNIYALNPEVPKYIKQILTLLKGKVVSNTMIVGNFNTPLHQWVHHPDRKSIRKH